MQTIRPLFMLGVLLASCASAAAQPVASGHGKKIRVAQLKAAADSEVQLAEAFLTSDGGGRLRVDMSGPLTNGKLDSLFWAVDLRTMTYTTIQLTGDDTKDARRIEKVYNRHGASVPTGPLVDKLRDHRTSVEKLWKEMKDAVTHRATQGGGEESEACAASLEAGRAHGPSADDGSSNEGQQSLVCLGTGFADIQVWEIAKVLQLPVDHLNETYIGVDWIHSTPMETNAADSFSINGSAFCWANPLTFAGTHWFTVFCPPAAYAQYQKSFDYAKTGQYVNVDFPLFLNQILGTNFGPALTSVTSTAAVQYTYGFANWGTSLSIDAENWLLQSLEEHFFLTGHTEGGAFEYNCNLLCNPSQADVDSCSTGSGEEIAGYWDWNECRCVRGASPIIIDLDSDGLQLTDPQHGVAFDIFANGTPVRVGWTRAEHRDALLALDRNHNGLIDDGRELFGNVTAQPPTPKKGGANGFLALGEFDRPANGGDGDGQITANDAVYTDLRLWIDANHDGISQPAELKTLAECGVRAIALHYVLGRRTDEFGNEFRFRSHVTIDRDALDSGPLKRQAVDVFLAYESIR